MNKKIILYTLALTLSGCASTSDSIHDYRSFLHNKGVDTIETAKFNHCRGYGCDVIDTIIFNESQWKELDYMFTPPSKTAEQERKRIAIAIGWFERQVGKLNGTDKEIHGTFKKLGKNQHDCVDESSNSTVYMSLMEQRGHLKFHKVRKPQVRAPFFGGGNWPHMTAVITETATGEEFAVDSWFENNGYPAHIALLEEWTWGWKPEKLYSYTPK